MKQRVLGIIAGLIAGFLCVAAVEAVSSQVYPPPEGMDLHDAQAFREFVSGLPMGAFLLVLAAHGLGAFAAGLTCGLVVREHWLIGSLALGTLFLIAGIGNLVMIPHPQWFAIVDVALYLPLAIAGGTVAGTLAAKRSETV